MRCFDSKGSGTSLRDLHAGSQKNLMMAPTRIILDMDLAMGAGGDVDDGFALAMAVAEPDIQIDLLTTVHGNTDLESATILTGVLMNRLGIPEIPMYKGAPTPFIHPEKKRTPPEHVLKMKDGAIPPSPGYAPFAIIEHVLASPGELIIVAIGPLTNIAIAITLEPRIIPAIKEIVIMGGIFMGTMPHKSDPGEFNVSADPEAAQTVLRSGIPQRWVGLDVTLHTKLTQEEAEKLKSSKSPFARFAGESALEWMKQLAEWFPRPSSWFPSGVNFCHMHDPLALAVVAKPELCEFKHMAVSIVTGDIESKGVMLSDRLESDHPPAANCQVAVSVQAEEFQNYFVDLVESL